MKLFFNYRNINSARSENYKSLSWDPQLVSELYTMYIEEPLSMQCNQSNGYRFPGYNWESARITELPILPPIHKRYCHELADAEPAIVEGFCDLLGECIY